MLAVFCCYYLALNNVCQRVFASPKVSALKLVPALRLRDLSWPGYNVQLKVFALLQALAWILLVPDAIHPGAGWPVAGVRSDRSCRVYIHLQSGVHHYY